MTLLYGPQAVEQRCLFHKVRNVTDNCRSEFQGEQKREEKKQFLKQAHEVYQAESAEEAKRWLVSCGASFRQVGSFGSQKGAEVALYIQVKHLHARWSKQV